MKAKNVLIRETETQVAPAVMPAFSVFLRSHNPDESPLDVLGLPEFKNSEELLKMALQKQIKKPSEAVRRYKNCCVTFPGVCLPSQLSLQISDERLHVAMKRLGSREPFSVWFPVQVDPETAQVEWDKEKMEVSVTVGVVN